MKIVELHTKQRYRDVLLQEMLSQRDARIAQERRSSVKRASEHYMKITLHLLNSANYKI